MQQNKITEENMTCIYYDSLAKSVITLSIYAINRHAFRLMYSVVIGFLRQACIESDLSMCFRIGTRHACHRANTKWIADI